MDNEGAYAQDVSSLAAAPAKTGPTAAAVVLEIPEFKTTPYKAEPLANRQTTSESGRGVHPPVATRTSRHPWIVTWRPRPNPTSTTTKNGARAQGKWESAPTMSKNEKRVNATEGESETRANKICQMHGEGESEAKQ